MWKWLPGAAAAAGMVLSAGSASSQPTPVPPAAPAVPFTSQGRSATIKEIEARISATYLFHDRVPAIVAALDEGLSAGRFDGESPGDFARVVTAALQGASPDGHLYLRDDPDRYAAALAPPKSDRGLEAHSLGEALRLNHGVAQTDLLAGGIRYLRISGFKWIPGQTAAVYDEAIRFLAGGDAIVIDLRGNAGGESGSADHLLNALLPPHTPLYTYDGVDAGAGSRTAANRASGLLAGKPLYVLVDGHTGSAAEAFSYALQQVKAGTIVGDPTYGAANNNREIPIAPRFILSVSYRRPVSPISKTNWEGTGVKPDIAVPGVEALAAAEVDALDRLSSKAGLAPETLAAYRWARVAGAARLQPPAWNPIRLQALAGQYGTTSVQFQGDGLRLSRADRPKWHQAMRLIPLTEDGLFSVEAFAFDDLRVRLTGTALEYLYGSEDSKEVAPREAPKGS